MAVAGLVCLGAVGLGTQAAGQRAGAPGASAGQVAGGAAEQASQQSTAGPGSTERPAGTPAQVPQLQALTTQSLGWEAPAAKSSAPKSPAAQIPAAGSGLPTTAELDAARADVDHLSTRALAGQVIVAEYMGTGAGDIPYLMGQIGLGGVIAMGGNVPSSPSARVDALRSASGAARAAMARTERDWPPLVAVDQEGGVVTRVAEPLTRFPAPMAVGAAGSAELARRVALASGRELRGLGFTMVFAPSADVGDSTDAVIGTRALGSEPHAVAEMATALVRGYVDAGIVPVAKHFPGHGRLATDSHADRPVLPGSLEMLESEVPGSGAGTGSGSESGAGSGAAAGDVAPFRTVIDAGAPAVMAGHIVASGIDPEAPATLSRPLLTEVLRERYGFRGLVVTDSMAMGAITRYVPARDVGARALVAGADVVLMPSDPVAVRDGIEAAVTSGALSRDRLVDAAARMVATLRAGARGDSAYLSSASSTPATPGGPAGPSVSDAPGGNRRVADDLAAASITQVSGVCGARLVGPSIVVRGGTSADRAALTAAARRAGLPVGRSGAESTRVMLLGGPGWYAGTDHAAEARATRSDVVVATDSPAYLGMARGDVAKLAVWGRTPATWDALVAVLLGRVAPGRLPVPIPGSHLGAGCSAD